MEGPRLGFVRVLLFLLLLLLLFIIVPITEGRTHFSNPSNKVYMKGDDAISLCYGVFYGKVSIDPVIFFVDYYRKLGVNRVVAFLHPKLSELLPTFEAIPGLSIKMWNVDYQTNSSDSHRENHRLALKECISKEFSSSVKSIIICDPDEFLYFNPHKYRDLHHFIRENRKQPVGQISLPRMYYEVDLCVKENKPNITIWDSPYRSTNFHDSAHKSIIFSDKFQDLPPTRFEHSSIVEGTTALLKSHEAHFKHYRRFSLWTGECTVKKSQETSYKEHKDKNDPAQKSKFYKRPYKFIRDNNLSEWMKFVESEAPLVQQHEDPPPSYLSKLVENFSVHG